MRKIKWMMIIVMVTIIGLTVKAQNQKRYELSSNYEDVAVFSAENSGVFILEKIKNDRKNIELKLTLIDRAFEVKWTTTLKNENYTLDRIKLSADKKKVFVAFYSDSKKNQWSHRIMYNEKVRILSVNLTDGSYDKMDQEIEDNATLKDFGSSSEMVYAVFSDKNAFKSRMYVKVCPVQSTKNVTVQLAEEVKNAIDFIGAYTDDSDGSIYTMYSFSDKKNICCQIDKITADGKLVKISKTPLTDEGEWPFDCDAFRNGSAVSFFGYDMQAKAQGQYLIEPASAFSMLKVEDNKVTAFATTSFAELNNPMIMLSNENDLLTSFFEKKAKESKLKKGTLYQGFNTITHSTIKSGDLYYSFFESYAPIYEVTTTQSTIAGMPDKKTKTYKETFFPHLQVACFDEEGNLKWDQNCKLSKFTYKKGNANTNWQVAEDGTVSAITHTDSYDLFFFKAKNGIVLKEEQSNSFKDVFTKDEYADMVSGKNILLSGSQYPYSKVMIPFATENGNWLICYVSRKDRKSTSYLTFKPYKF